MPRVGLAASHEVDAIWPNITKRMQVACDKCGGDLSSVQLWQLCRSGQAFLMCAIEDRILMASVWRFETWPSGTVFRCMAICGDRMSDWLDETRKFAVEKAREGGATRIVTEGRKGWGDLFPEAKTMRHVYEVKI